MSKAGVVTGVVTAAAVGMGIGMMLHPLDEKDKRRMRKSCSQLFTTIGAVADHVLEMYR